MPKWSKSRRFRNSAVVILILLSVAAAIVRVILFSQGVLYGESAAKMASLAVAAIVVTAGAIIMKISQSGRAGTAKREESTGSMVSSISALLGLALAAYTAAELVAPNTPVAAGAPAGNHQSVPVFPGPDRGNGYADHPGHRANAVDGAPCFAHGPTLPARGPPGRAP